MTARDPQQVYRQPLVTAIALILGFCISFLADWVTDVDFILVNYSDYILLIGIVAACILNIVALSRILQMHDSEIDSISHYKRTLRYFTLSISLILVTILCSALI